MNRKSGRRAFLSNAVMAGTVGLLPNTLLSAAQQRGEDNMAEPPLVFLFQGDSITDGNRGRTEDPNHIMGHGYAFAVASRVGADFPASGFTFYNRGVSGNTVTDLQKRWQNDTIALKPHVLSVLIGINDTAAVVENRPAAKSVTDFEEGYRQLLSDAKAAMPDTLFVLGLPFVYPVAERKEHWEKWKEETQLRAEKVKLLAKEFNAVLVDYPSLFDKAATKAPIEYWVWDGIHPTVPAHELMAREWILQAGNRLAFLKKYR